MFLFEKTALTIFLALTPFFSFTQTDTIPSEKDSVYLSANLNLLGIPQGEFIIGFEVILDNLFAVELGIGRSWENYQYSILEEKKVYADYLGRYQKDSFETGWESGLTHNWNFNLSVSKYFNVSKKVLPFVSAEYKWKNVFSVVKNSDNKNGSNIWSIYSQDIHGRQIRTSNKVSVYGGFSTNRKLIMLKIYAGAFVDRRNIEYPELFYNTTDEQYSFNQMSFSDNVFGLEVGLKVGLGAKFSPSEITGI